MMNRDSLLDKIFILSEKVWERKAINPHVENWLNNFDDNEKTPMLYLLSNFMYFGSRQMRELLKSLYRDLFKYPIVAKIRKHNNDTTDLSLIEKEFKIELSKSRFLGVGNPSESGYHLLYYFRQENRLPKDLFIHTHQILGRRGTKEANSLRETHVQRYIFIDDFCGSGEQGNLYLNEIVDDIKNISDKVEICYFVIFSTSSGLNTIKNGTKFDNVDCLFELDDSFKIFDSASRYFTSQTTINSKKETLDICMKYGSKLVPNHPLGYKDCQLLIGFHHNTPDNTLPIFWYDEPEGINWSPIFKRYPKFYGSLL
jgi:hypothetical protein